METRCVMEAFLPWLSRVMQVITELENDPDSQVSANVPCGTCELCCHNTRVPVTDKEAENPALKAVMTDSGWIIPKKGTACIHLNNGCEIYDQRPRTCRAFDCRKRLVTNMQDDHTKKMNEQWNLKEWETPENQIFLSSIRSAAATYHNQKPDATISQITSYAIVHWPEYLGVVSEYNSNRQEILPTGS